MKQKRFQTADYMTLPKTVSVVARSRQNEQGAVLTKYSVSE